MKSGKVLLMIFLVLSSAIGLAIMQDFASDENQSVSVDDYSSQVKKINIKVSDGVGSKDKD
ncbi:MAG: hypothetical protein WD018_01205 [Nitrosopumilaceae archaeon]